MRRIVIVLAVGLAGLASCGDDSSNVSAEDPGSTTSSSASSSTTVPGTTASPSTTTASSSTTAGAVPTTTESPPTTCSASGLSRDLPDQSALPAPVAETRQAIVDAAIACDWSALRKLTAAGGDEFTYSFGGGTDPVAYWQEQEPDPNGPLRAMVIVLRAPFRALDIGDGSGFAWPEAFHADPLTDAHRRPLAELYSEADFARFREFGGYVGWRVGIDSDGEWRYFVEGD